MKRRKATRAHQYTSPRYVNIGSRLAANVRRLREERGWTQLDCSVHCGEMEPAMLRRIESATTNVTMTTLARLCDGFDVDVKELFVEAAPLARRRPGRPVRRVTVEVSGETKEHKS